MATSQDDSFPRLLRALVRLRQLVLARQELLAPFADSLLRALRAQLAPLAATPLAPLLAHPSDRHDWMRALLRSPQGPAAAPALRLLCEASRVRADALAWLEALFDLPHIALFYPQMFAFCEANYKKQGPDPAFVFLFIDVADAMLHAAPVLAPALQAALADQIASLLQEVVAAVVAAVDTLWQHAIAADTLPASELVDGEALEALNRLLATYQRVELGAKVILCRHPPRLTRSPAQLLADAAVNCFLRTMQARLCDPTLPAEEVLRLIRAFFAALATVANWVGQLPVSAIVGPAARAEA